MASSARVVSVALLVGLAPAAGAQPAGRRVAVVNATTGPAGLEATAALRADLEAAPGIDPLAPGDLARALEEDALGDPAAGRLAGAAEELAAAAAALDRFQTRKSLAALGRAEEILLRSPPGGKARELFADARFVAGLAHLRDQNRGLAEAAFALAVRLEPSRGRPDPARYPPEVIEVVGRAARPPAGKATLTVSATFDGAPVFLDGVEVGATPWQGEVASGFHLVQVWSPSALPDGRLVELDDEPLAVRLDLQPLPLADQAHALRRALIETRDPVEVRAALAATTELVGVDAAVLVQDGADGAPTVAIYERVTSRLSLARPAAAAVGLLGLLTPAELPDTLDLIAPPPGGEPRPWYLRPAGLGSLIAAGVVGLTTAIVLTTGDAEPLPRNGNPVGFE